MMIQIKRAHDSQIVRAEENLKLSYGGPSQRRASGTNQRIKALFRAIKEENVAINRDLVHNQACRLSHDIHVVSHSFITFKKVLLN